MHRDREEDNNASDVPAKMGVVPSSFLAELMAAPLCSCACTKVDADYPNLHCTLDGQPVEMEEDAAQGLNCKIQECPCACKCDYSSVKGFGDAATVSCLLNGARVAMAVKHMVHFNCAIPDGPKPCNPPCKNGVCDSTKGVCNCRWGFVGNSCDIKVCPAVGSRQCNNKGSCEDGVCKCVKPFTGKARSEERRVGK